MSGPDWRDVLLVLAAFMLPTGVVWGWLVWRGLASLKREQSELRSEGYPPPGPPTTDSQPDVQD